MNKLIIIDGNSLINRAYYALQNPMITKDGVYTHGIFGFINMLAKIKKDYSPTHLAVAFDTKAPTFRHEQFGEYKAGRKKMPLELAMQIPLLKDILDAMNIKRIELEGYEADDLIGTIAKKAEKTWLNDEKTEIYILTGDKDELQLASDTIKIIFTKKGVSQFEIYDSNKMFEVYGFSPEQFIDYKGLMGDQSDNIPGIPGVGEKTASKLILEFGSIENLLENTDRIPKEGLRNKIEENRLMAIMSKKLATIETNVPIEIDFEELKLIGENKENLMKIYAELEFNKFLKQLAEEISDTSNNEIADNRQLNGIDSKNDNTDKTQEKNIPKTEKLEIKIIKTVDEIDEIKKLLSKEKSVAVKVIGDNSRKNIPWIEGIALAFKEKKILYYIGDDKDVVESLFSVINDEIPSLIGHDIKDDIYMLMANGIKNIKVGFDTAICQYLLDSNRSNYDLSTIVASVFRENMQNIEEFAMQNSQMTLFSNSDDINSKYCAKWCEYIFALKEILEVQIEKENMSALLYDVELPLVESLAFMEKEGFSINKNNLLQIGSELAARIDELKKKIYSISNEEFNINSTQQLGNVLFEKLGLPPSKKTKTGYSTGADVLERLKYEHEIIPHILEYRTLAKLKGTYIDGLIPLIHADGKIHAHFMQTVTATGRLSCVEPNLQNIPIRQEIGRTIRKVFVPKSEEFTLLGADYSQIELRVLAHMSGDENLIEAFNNDEDIHRLTAARVLEIPMDEITIEERSKAKAVNFGVIYGMSSFGLSEEIKVSRKDAEKYIEEYFNKHKKVKEFMDKQIEEAKIKGFVTTILNRKRYIKEINATNFMVRQMGERLAMNTPIQGSAADIIKIAMIKVYRALKEGNYKSNLILQIHDELIVETHKDEIEDVKKLIKENMEEVMLLQIKLSVEVNEGANWYELK